MIRVNLLPEKRAQARRTAAVEGQAWLFVVLGIVAGLIVGWALNAWIDYIHFTANGGGAPGM